MTKKREYSFDILRIISMFMVIVVHVSNVYSRSFGIIGNKSFFISLVFNTISRISVPIFLMISGALLFNRSFNKKKYFQRIIKFILLIIVWDIFYLIWEYYYLNITYTKLYMLIFTPYRAHLWFLYTILILYIIQPVLKLIFDRISNNFKFILLIMWFLFSTLSIINYNIANYFTIFSYMGFFIIGNYLYTYIKDRDLTKYNWFLIISIVCLITTSVLLNYFSSVKRNYFYNIFFAYRTPFIILSSFAFFILVVCNFKKDIKNKFILMLSDVSLGVYLIHGVFLDITVKVFSYQLINSLIGIPTFSLIIFIFSVISVYILKKIKIINYFL